MNTKTRYEGITVAEARMLVRIVRNRPDLSAAERSELDEILLTADLVEGSDMPEAYAYTPFAATRLRISK